MDQRTLRVLEYHKIIGLLEDFVLSELGKSAVGKLNPSSSFARIQKMLDETSQAHAIINHCGYSPMDIFPDISTILQKAKIGSVLSAGELLKVGLVLRISGRVKGGIEEYPYPEAVPHILHKSKALKLHKIQMDEIFRCIETEDRISDYASDRLANIRRRITRANERIRERLNSLIRSPQFQKLLQEPIVTIRNERYVVPVKQEHRGSVPGMIHDQSASGATVFIEPMAVVEANNELRELMIEEQREIEKVLLELTMEVQSSYETILNNLELLAALDVIFAKASFSRSYKGIHPEVVPEPYIDIINGRHPLIDKDEVVPITVSLGERSTCLIITGPNTGGKTVTLKTVGLFALMTQSGLHIPADYGSKMGIFEGVFADIGDEQSIEQSLSTFSSHMVHIANIMEEADDKSLVLFDELGAGTDPIEGAALAMAILNFLCARRTCTIATTHYSELKVFAMTQAGMENASMEFDIDTLRPTFRLLMGIPGKSNAFEIARRLGLKEKLIDAAREFISQDEKHFEDVLSDMEKSRIQAKEDQEEAKAHLDEIRAIRGKLDEKERLIKGDEEKILRDARGEARNILRKAKDQADEILHEMRMLANQSQDKEQRREMEQARKRLKRSLDSMEEAIGDSLKPKDGLLIPPKNLKPGESVYIANLDQTGQVLSISAQGDEVQVQVGIMKINVHISNLKRVQNESRDSILRTSSVAIKNKAISMELDLRGQDLEGAIVNVDKYLDDMFLAGLQEVVLIHGKGTGVLRNGIHKHLRQHPHVDSFRLGRFGEGESGVTIVELK
ncbi:MAG TPA: endonuclease MutS2 [Clostridia bacterium]|nr:endonuclease MutS2 [Clostridia bacterium]